jgi:beta-galactosidase
MAVTLTAGGLAIAGREIPVYSGTVHYWRLDRARWGAILDQVQALGFGMVETYIPWSVHETAPGRYDWGQDDPRKDVEAFMALCEERGLWLLARPGPLINAELTDFGFPEWVLLDPAVQAHNAVGSLHLDAAWGLHPPRPFPVPSYASEVFYDYVGGWFDAVCPILARHLAPRGCIVAVQSDNETCYLFHDQPYATDYSPGSLALYRAFLARRYESIAVLNGAYATGYADFAAVEPPRDGGIGSRQDLPWHLDWVRYKEYQITWSVARCARMLRERGITDVPIFHDIAYQQRTPLDVAGMEADPAVDWVGMNLYRNKEEYGHAVQQARFLAGTTRLPFIPELGCGIWSHHPRTSTPDEQELITLGALMHGVKAFNLYMLVERERWQGSPITRHGALRPDYADFYARLTAFLHAYRFWRFRRDPPVLVLRNYDLARYVAATSTLNYAHADLLGLPPELFTVDVDLDLRWDAGEADEQRTDSWFGTLAAGLHECGVEYDLADTHISSAHLARYPLIFLQATDFMDLGDQGRILAAVEGGATVIVGPGLPYTDPTLQHPGVLSRYLDAPGIAAVGGGRLIWAAPAHLPDLIARLAPAPEFRCADPALDLAVLRDGEQTLLFVANPTPAPCATDLRFSGRRTLRAAWPPGHTLCGAGSIPLALPAYAVRIWEVHCD